MSLTDTAVRLAKPRDRAYRLSDGRGLCLLIQPSGSKWWRLRYRFQGAEQMLSLGTYPDISLSEARNMLSALVYLPTPYINLYGRLGALEWNSYGRCYCTAGVAMPIAFHCRGLSAAYGVGGTTNGRGNLNLRLEWDKLKISDARRANLVTVGLIRSFSG